MTWAMGSKGRLAIDFETVYGTTPGSPAGKTMPIHKSSISGKQNLVSSATIIGRRDPVQPSLGNIDVSGNVVVPLTVRDIGFWLKAAFGAPVTSGSGPYVHTYKIGNTQPSMVLEQGFTDVGQYFLYNGCKVSKMSFSFGGDGELTVSIDVMGAKETLATTSFDATMDTVVYAPFGNFQAAITEGGSAIAICTEVTIDIDFGLDGATYCIGGAGTRSALAEGNVTVTGKVKAMFQDAVLLAKAIAGTESALKITLTNGAHILEITVPELMYGRQAPAIDGPKGVYVDLPFTGYYQNDAINSAIQIKLTNDVVSYA